MDESEMIHDFVATSPLPSAQARSTAWAALQGQTDAGLARARRKGAWPWRRLASAGSAAALLGLASLFAFNPLLRGGGKSTAVAAVLLEASSAAAHQPAQVLGPGEYAYTKTEGAYLDKMEQGGHVWGALVRTTREAWIGLDGSGRIRQTTQAPQFLVPADRARWVAAGSPPLISLSSGESYDRQFGPGGLTYPLDVDGFRHDQLDRLAADPASLGAATRAEAEKNSNPLGWEMLTIVGDLLSESVAPPELRASLYQVATTIPGIELAGDVTDRAGWHGVAVAVARDYLRLELVFDPKTSQLLASEQTLRVRSSETDAPVGTPISYTLYLDSTITRSMTGT